MSCLEPTVGDSAEKRTDICHTSSFTSVHLGRKTAGILNSPALIIVFKGRTLDKVMRHHRISMIDLYGALRNHQVINVAEVEACFIGEWFTYLCLSKWYIVTRRGSFNNLYRANRTIHRLQDLRYAKGYCQCCRYSQQGGEIID